MKKIVITGASSGIGEAAARALHTRGHEVFVAARSLDKLEALQKSCGERMHIAQLDVRHYSDVQRVMEQAIQQMGQIDVLINNAGLGYFDRLDEGKIDEWNEMIDINIKGVLNMLHVCLPHLIASRGHVINLGSIASHFVFPNSGVYSATKHAVFAISESIRTELPDKVRVTTISPGSVNTPFVDSTTNEKLLSEYKSYFASGMSAEWIAETICFAVDAPPNAVVSEIITRPNRQVK
jgi:NADP-dependent 3-hydroxy acid dehydrogenase YdfG